MPYDRRRFIKTVLLGSGAVFMGWREVSASSSPSSLHVRAGYTHTDLAREYFKGTKTLLSPSKTDSTDCVIIGGGSAGIAAAWRLKKSGKNFLLLESEAHLGGVMHNPSPEWNGISYPLGSTYFARYNDVYKELLDDLHIHPIETGEDAYFFGSDKVVVDPWNPRNINDLPLSKEDREAFKVFRDFLLALPLPTYPLERASKETVKEYDSMSAREFVQRFKSPMLVTYMDLYARSVLGAPLGTVNAYSFLSFYSVEFGDAFNLPCYTMQGGLGVVASAAEQFLGDHARTNAVTVRIENVGDGVEVSYINATTGEHTALHAKKAIVATSKQIARHQVVGLPDDQRKAIEELSYAPYITLALCCNAPLFFPRAFDYWINDAQGRFTDIIDVTSSYDASTKQLDRTGPYVYLLSAPQQTKRFSKMNESELERALVAFAQDMAVAVADNISGAHEKIEEIHVFGWRHSMVIPTVGSYQRLAPVISRSHGSIHFAHSDNDIAPGWENAVWHGADAGSRI